jgi:hypothetical protein
MGTLAADSRTLLVDLLNSNNGTSFGYDELVFSQPSVTTLNNRNTLVNATAANGSQFTGSLNFYYNRVDFADLFNGLTLVVGGLGLIDTNGFVTELNNTFGLGLTADDLVNQALPSSPTYPYTMTIAADVGSYAYTGSFTVTVHNANPVLGNNLATTVLGNIGSDASTLAGAVDDVNGLAAAVIYMNLTRYEQTNAIRSLQYQQVTVTTLTVVTTGTLHPTATSRLVQLTALASGCHVAAPTGFPVDGWEMYIRIQDNGIGHFISYDAIYRGVGRTLPTVTTPGVPIYLHLIYNASAAKWDVIP